MEQPTKSNTALNAAIITFVLGCIVMLVSLWLMIIYIPLFIASFILSIVAMSQGKTGSGVSVLLANIIIPSLIFGVGFMMGLSEFNKEFNSDYETLSDKSVSETAPPTTYIKNLEIYDFQAKYYTNFLEQKEPGVRFKLKNNGDSTLSRVEVTIYFKNEEGSTIYETSVVPFNTNSIMNTDPPLKPGYIWSPGDNQFHALTNIPSEWQPGNEEYEITDISFENE